MDPCSEDIAPRGTSDREAVCDDGARSSPAPGLPWYAVPVLTTSRNPSLRPVTEGEYEELDDDPGWWPSAAAGGTNDQGDRSPDHRPSPAGSDPAGNPPLAAGTRAAGDPAGGARAVAVAVGRAVKARRWAAHESQKAYAARTGRDQGRLSRLERGLSRLSVEDLVAIAAETGRTIRLQIVPDGIDVDAGGERVDAARLGDDGSVRVAVGPAPPGDARWRGIGPVAGPIS